MPKQFFVDLYWYSLVTWIHYRSVDMANELKGYYRARKVILSCKTIEQLHVAKKYAFLALRQYRIRNGSSTTAKGMREELVNLISMKMRTWRKSYSG